ncbi:MAG: DUF2293 domain-containing protein [Planctomycetota bacterium]|nr:DUF2293 domain-containing protein [Planctomycetota bacterium]MDA0932656.1 DUF2293 domain-containing protein [Planctomycetota bacterium]MDA1223104.1 DUF2293 domain-containing protein [Planctomycetota bacterium]
MPEQDRNVRPGPDARSVRTEDGRTLRVPDGWELLPPGDAGLTRRVKAGGPTWTVQEKKGRRTFSRGVFAPADRIAACRAALEDERQDPAYAKRLEAGRRRRAVAQEAYAEEFEGAVERFLAFDARHRALGADLARAIAVHATPVGSGTVARTQRIPVERRAEAATIAWLRHQTTGYDDMRIPRVKGKRREVRRQLAERSRELLAGYRRGADIDPQLCPLRSALAAKT